MKKLFAISMMLSFALLVGSAAASSFDFSLSADYVSSCPCTPNEVKIDVQNLYQKADTISLELDLPDGWGRNQGFVEPEIMLGSGESGTVTLYITPPCDSGVGTHKAVVTATSAMTGNEVSKTLDIETMKCHYVSLSTDETYIELCQEGINDNSVEVVVENQGKSSESFMLSTNRDWATFSDSTLEIEAGGSRVVNLVLDPEGLDGTNAVTIKAQSETSYAEDSEQLNINVENCFGFEARLTPSEKGTETGASSPPSVSIGENVKQDSTGGMENDSGLTGMATLQEQSWEAMIVAIIIVIVVLAIIYILVKK